MAEVYNQTGKPTPSATANADDAPTSYYVNAGTAVVANRTLPKVAKKRPGSRRQQEDAGAERNASAKDNEAKEENKNQEEPVDLEAMKFTLPPGGATMKLEDDTV